MWLVSEFLQQLNLKALDHKNAMHVAFYKLLGWVMAINYFQLVLLLCGIVNSRRQKAEVISRLLCLGILLLEKRWQYLGIKPLT